MFIITVITGVIVIIIVTGFVSKQNRRERIALMTPEEKQKHLEEKNFRLAETNQRKLEIEYGAIYTAMICPHCQIKGKVYAKPIKLKKGVSGAKATGAILTGGLSILAVGLSRKEANTQAHCDNCNSTWIF